MKAKTLARSVLAGRERLAARAQEVLRQNDMGGWTRMASELYPHQWSWDSGFIAIGLAHLDTPCRAGAASGVDGGLNSDGGVGQQPSPVFGRTRRAGWLAQEHPETGAIVYEALFPALAEDANTPVVSADGKVISECLEKECSLKMR
jgi:hypothetical protein